MTTPSKTNSEIAIGIAKQFINQDKAPVNFGYLCKLIEEVITSKDKVILEREAEIEKLKNRVNLLSVDADKIREAYDKGLNAELLDAKETLEAEVKSWKEIYLEDEAKIQELEKELAFWKKTCEEGTYDLILKARVDGLSVELADAKQEISDIKSYSTGEVEEVASDLASIIAKAYGSTYSGSPAYVKDILKDALSSIHQKYRGELGEARDLLKKILDLDDFDSDNANEIYNEIYNEGVDYLNNLTKLIGGK